MIILDQASKWWVQHALLPGESLPIYPPWVAITHVRNPGAAFGLLPNQTPLLVAVTAAAVTAAWLQRAAIRDRGPVFRWGVTLGLAGAIGNLIDRVRVGQVIDFVDIRYFWVFNLADSCIVIGVALLIWTLLFNRSAESGSRC